MNRSGVLLMASVVVAGCGSSQPDSERLGDVAWHEARWAAAVADYKAAGNTPDLLAKEADAAFHGGMLAEAAEAWTQLGLADSSRAGEAAAGLVRAADMAEHDGDQSALALAILGIRKVAPGWPLGRLAVRLAQAPALPPADAAEILPAALATASNRAAADPLLAALGHADRARGACDQAVPILDGLLHRNIGAGTRDSVGVDLQWCELSLGLVALQNQRPGPAERWFQRAAQRDPNGPAGRRALIGYGDARMAEGDLAAAMTAWEAAIAADPTDSIAALARRRLAPPPVADTDTMAAAGAGNAPDSGGNG